MTADWLEAKIAVGRSEAAFELQGHVFAVEIEDHVGADAIFDKFDLYIAHGGANLLDLLSGSAGRRGEIGVGIAGGSGVRRSLRWSGGRNVQMRSEIRVQFGLIQAKRPRLAAGHGSFHGFDFLFDAGRRLRAGDDDRGRRSVKNHQQGDNCRGVSGPADDAERDAPGTQLARRQIIAPQFTADGKLLRPEGYRKWVYVSSGYGMSYSQSPDGMQMFTNVFVTPAAYDYFVANGKWLDKTMFVLEVYGSTSRGSINKHGSYQTEFSGLDVEVKDERRFADRWAYFNFDGATKAASADSPSKNDCWKCHEQNAAVEHSFVQLYPELLKIAWAQGTIKAGVRLDE